MAEVKTGSIDKGAVISASNSFEGNLAAGAFFTGEFVDCLGYAQVAVIIQSNQDGVLFLDYSVDGKKVTRTSTLEITSGPADYFSFAPRARYIRVRFSSPLAASVILQTRLNREAIGFTFLPLRTVFTDTAIVLSTRSVISGKNSTTGNYENVEIDEGKNLRITAVQHVIADPNNSSSTLIAAGPADWSLTKIYSKSDLVFWKTFVYQSLMNNNVGNEPVEGTFWTSVIAGSHVFTGVASSTLGVAGIQVTLKTDVNCDVFVDQSPDGVNWDISDRYEFNSLVGNFGVTVQAVNSFFRVRVRNRNSFAPTFFRLQTCLCPIVEAVPRSLDEELAFKTCIKDIEDVYGHKGEITPLNELKVANPVRIAGVTFQQTADANFWTLTNNGAGSAAAINYIATLTSGTANLGYGQITSSRKARFVTGHANHNKCIVRIPVVVAADCVRRWGAYSVGTGAAAQTPLDGFYFELSAAGILSVNAVKSGQVTSVASGNFNGQRREYHMDMDMHNYDIVYTVFEIKFYIDKTLIHTLTPTSKPYADNLSVPVTATSINTAIAPVGGTLELWVMLIQRLGAMETSPKYVHIAGAVTAQVLKIGAGRLHKIVYNTFPNAATCNIYDAVTATNAIALMNPTSNTFPGTVDYDIDFYDGLCITTTGALDLTICYE